MAPPKKPETQVVTVKMLKTKREQLERIARVNGWTLNKLCRQILETYVDTQSRR